MRRALVLLLVLGGLGGAGYWFYTKLPANTEQQAGGRRRAADPLPVLAVRAEQRDVPVYLDGLGTVQAFNSVAVKPQVDGPLVEVLFREGQDVRAGDVLARIDPRPFQAALDQALARKQQDEATLANARLDAKRFAGLAASNFASAQQADTARALVAQLEAQVRGDQSQVDTARLNLGYATITAPIDGRTGLRQVDVGNQVRPTDTLPLTVITQLRPISVLFTLPQQALPAVARAMQEGMPSVQALRQGANQGGTAGLLDRGELAVLDNQVDPQTGTIKLKATFPNAALQLWPGGFVNVRLLADTLREVVTVPTAAVQRGPRGAYVFVVSPEPEVPAADAPASETTGPDGKPRQVFTVARRAVQVGHEEANRSVVTDGLEPGDMVVADGAQRLTDSARVALAGPDGMAPDAAPRERPAGTAQRRGGGRRG